MIGLWLAGAARAEEPLRLEADRIVLEAGRVEAEGSVRLTLDGRTIEAARLEMEGASILLLEPSLEQDGVAIRAGRAQLDGGALVLDAPTLDPCACCAGSPWAVRAETAVYGPEAIRWRRGVLLVGGRPVLPLPAGRLPLTPPRLSPGLPAAGRGPDGLFVALPLTLRPPGTPPLTLTPELRQVRGPRLSAELGGEGVNPQITASVAYDLSAHQLRGAAMARAAARRGPLYTGLDATWVGDEAWIADYGASLLDRQVPWTRQRAWVELGMARVEVFGWQDAAPTTQLVPSFVVSALGHRVGPLRLDGLGRVDWVDGAPRAEVGQSAGLVLSPGPARIRLDGEGRLAVEPGALVADGRAAGDALLFVWGHHGALTHELGLGARATAAVGTGAPGPLSAADPLGLDYAGLRPAALPALPPLAQGVALGPLVQSAWVGPPGRARLELGVPLSPELGPGLSSALTLRRGDVAISGSVGARRGELVALGEARLGGESLDLAIQYAGLRGEARVDQLRATAALPLTTRAGRLSPGAAALAEPGALLGWELGLGWEAGCGCASAGASVGFAVDRVGPQIAATVRLNPGGFSAAASPASGPR